MSATVLYLVYGGGGMVATILALIAIAVLVALLSRDSERAERARQILRDLLSFLRYVLRRTLNFVRDIFGAGR